MIAESRRNLKLESKVQEFYESKMVDYFTLKKKESSFTSLDYKIIEPITTILRSLGDSEYIVLMVRDETSSELELSLCVTKIDTDYGIRFVVGYGFFSENEILLIDGDKKLSADSFFSSPDYIGRDLLDAIFKLYSLMCDQKS